MPGFPDSKESSFDLILASDVVYLPECVEPLIQSIRYFLKPESGRCLFVNNRVRLDGFQKQIDQLLVEYQLKTELCEEIIVKDQKFKCYTLSKQN